MKNRNKKITNYWSVVLLTVFMTVSNLYANAYPVQAINHNWEETLAKLAQPDTVLTAQNKDEWDDEIVSKSDSVALEVTCKNELSAWVAGGLSTLSYQPTYGSKDNGFGGTFGLGYTRYLSKNWNLSLGAELSFYQSDFSQNKLHDHYDAVDLDPYAAQQMNFRYRVDNYEESQQLYNLNIPLMLQYQTKKQGNHRFFVAGGLKLGIPVSKKYESKNATIDSKGYYYDWHQTLNEPASLGYGVFNNQSAKGKFDVGLSYIGSLEAGIKWELPGSINLYTGLYADYGFNDILKGKHNDQFVVYDSYENNDFTTINSVLTSQYSSNNNTKSFTDKVSLLSFGFKLRLGFSAGCPVREKQKQEKIQFEYAPSYLETVRQSAETTQKAVEAVQELTDAIQQQTAEIANRQEVINTEKIKEIQNNDIEALDTATINYDLNVATLTVKQEKILDEYISILQNNPSAKIILTGHACNRGNYAGNMRIGQKRADLAKEYMAKKGIQAGRILTFTKGSSEPVCSNTNDINRKKNRRLEIQIIR